MARDFNGSSDSISVSLPQETGKITIAYTYQHDALPADDYPNRQVSLWRGNTTSTEANYYVIHRASTINFGWTSATSTYQELAGTFAADASEHRLTIAMDWDNDACSMWVDGVSLSVTTAGIATSPQTTGTSSKFSGQGVGTELWNGKLSEVGLWQGVAMGAKEANALAKGYTCDQVQPQHLARRWPFARTLQEVIGGTTVSASGTSIAAHPRVILPRRARLVVPAIAGTIASPTGVFSQSAVVSAAVVAGCTVTAVGAGAVSAPGELSVVAACVVAPTGNAAAGSVGPAEVPAAGDADIAGCMAEGWIGAISLRLDAFGHPGSVPMVASVGMPRIRRSGWPPEPSSPEDWTPAGGSEGNWAGNEAANVGWTSASAGGAGWSAIQKTTGGWTQ